jgi:probable phosphoglycerate mutase
VTELLFIRHGETDWNRQQRFQGQIDVPLNATGHAQAARVASRLAADRHDVLITSDLLRAREIPNAGLNRLRRAGGALQIDSWADAAHLEGLPEQASTAAGER